MKKSYLILLTVFFMLLAFSVLSSAEENTGTIYCIAHDGDTVNYPAYSEKSVDSAVKSGADAVSVGAVKTSDGVILTLRSDEVSSAFYGMDGTVSQTDYETLSKAHLISFDGSESRYHAAQLSVLIKKRLPLIVDGWEYRDEIAGMIKQYGAQDTVKLRGRDDAAVMAQWSAENGIDVVGIYYGNIIFSAFSHIDRLSTENGSWIQLQSGNFFSVLFNTFVMKKFDRSRDKAVCAIYDKDLCGQRTDNVQGYDDIIGRGYTVIETNQPELLIDYIKQLESERQQLSITLEKAKKRYVGSEYSAASKEKLSEAVKQAEAALSKVSPSLEIQKAQAELVSSVMSLCASNGSDTNERSLNITAGKITAVIIFGSLVLIGQIYVYKKKKK